MISKISYYVICYVEITMSNYSNPFYVFECLCLLTTALIIVLLGVHLLYGEGRAIQTGLKEKKDKIV